MHGVQLSSSQLWLLAPRRAAASRRWRPAAVTGVCACGTCARRTHMSRRLSLPPQIRQDLIPGVAVCLGPEYERNYNIVAE